MAYWNSRGLRGSTFEELINMTNERYRDHGLALVQKIPTSIKAVKLDKEKGNIKEAYFEKRSTVDYIGVVQGIPICFEAKETNKEYLPIQNIHDHQIAYMEDFEKQKGVSFLLVSFSKYNEHFFMPFSAFIVYLNLAKQGGRKSIPYKEFKKYSSVASSKGYYLHYLEALKEYIES